MRGRIAAMIVLGVTMTGSAVSATDYSECQCRSPAGFFFLGEQTCLQMPDGPRMATCVMTLNVTSWEVGKVSCGISRRDGNRQV